MSENLYNTAHKTPTKEYRDNYERIFNPEWNSIISSKRYRDAQDMKNREASRLVHIICQDKK